MLVCSKCGFSQIVTHRCPQCHEAWMEEKSTSHNKDYAELEKQLLQAHKDYGCELRDPNGTIWEYSKKLEKQRDDLLNTLNTVIVHYNSLEHEDDPSADYDVESAQRLLTRIKEGKK